MASFEGRNNWVPCNLRNYGYLVIRTEYGLYDYMTFEREEVWAPCRSEYNNWVPCNLRNYGYLVIRT